MFSKKKIIDSLCNRQFNTNCFLKPKEYKNKLIKSLHDDENKLYKNEIELDNIVNSISFSKNGNHMVTENQHPAVKIWSIDSNHSFKSYGIINHTGLKVNDSSIELYDDFSKIFVNFSKKLSVIDTDNFEILNLIEFEDNLKFISLNPNNTNLLAVSIEKKICKLDLRTQNLLQINRRHFEDSIYSFQFHPFKENLLLIASEKNGLHTFDLRNFKSTFYYNIFDREKSFFDSIKTYFHINANYNKNGDKIFVTRNNFNPVLFNSNESVPTFEFNEYGYYNSLGNFNLGIKTKCCFAGPNDEYVVAGSNDFNIYVWEIPTSQKSFSFINEKIIEKVDSAKFILEGHRSIVKQVTYSYDKSIIASSGIETSIKLWSIFPFKNSNELDKKNFSNNSDHERILSLEYKSVDEINDPLIFDKVTDSYVDMRLIDYFIKKLFLNKIEINKETGLEYNFSLQNFDFHYSEDYFSKFEQDLDLLYLKSIVISYTKNGKFGISKLTFSIDQIIVKELQETEKSFHMQKMPLVFEVRKIFQLKKYLTKSISYLSDQLILSGKLKNELNFYSLNSNCQDKLNCLEKISAKLEMLLNSILMIIEDNKEFYQKCNFLIQTLFNRVFNLGIQLNLDDFLNNKALDFEFFLNDVNEWDDSSLN